MKKHNLAWFTFVLLMSAQIFTACVENNKHGKLDPYRQLRMLGTYKQDTVNALAVFTVIKGDSIILDTQSRKYNTQHVIHYFLTSIDSSEYDSVAKKKKQIQVIKNMDSLVTWSSMVDYDSLLRGKK